MSKKTYNEKLHHSNGLPKIEFIGNDNKMAERFGAGYMLVAPPIEYDEAMRKVPKGKLTTSDEIRDYLAKRHEADFTCHLTAGLFINIAANASAERESSGANDITPYWRTLKKSGELNEKYPGGIDQHRLYLEMEGHKVIQRGKKYYVENYEDRLCKL